MMNRRDFVKFGLGGAGLAAGGGFVSRNEQKPSSTFSKKFGHPWWVKEIDKPKLAVCPWTKKDKTMIHDIVKATSAKIPALDGFFTSMDEAFGYGSQKSSEQWWHLDLPEYGIDTKQGKG
jgi:hypothetical protein